MLFFYAGLDAGGADVVPRRVWRRIVRLLRPAESAARRLIVIAARGIEVAPPKPRPEGEPTVIERLRAAGVVVREVNLGLACAPWRDPQAAKPRKSAPAIPAFPLIDPLRRFDKKAWDGQRPFPKDGIEPADGDEDVTARHLCRRLLSLKAALDDLPGQARRLARWNARRDARLKQPDRRPGRLSVMRPGRPPGYRKRPVHAVDDLLLELHSLARLALRPPDTS